jgi:hypothetical protein
VLCAFIISPAISDADYAVLTIDETINDEDIVAMLGSGEITNIQSFSTQKVFLDDFGKLRQIPLHQYDDYVFSFDPRNDGYSEKLKRFFYQDEKQFMFIPLEKQDYSPRTIIKKIDVILADIPHEVEFIGTSLPRIVPWLLFFAAFAGTCYFFKKIRFIMITFFPMTGFLFWGSLGFVLAALLVIFFSLLINPLRELLMGFLQGKKKPVLEKLFLYRYSWVSALCFFVLYGLVVYVSDISVIYCFSVFIILFGLIVFFLHNEIKQNQSSKHSRFSPLPISGESWNVLNVCITALPFMMAAVILLFISIFMHQSGSSVELDKTRFVTQADFDEHIRFQKNFSFIPLGENIENPQYKNYQMGDNGLVVDAGIAYSVSSEMIDEVSFPLGDMIHHLEGSSEQTIQWISFGTIIPLFSFLFLASFAVYLELKGRGRKKTISMYNDKRIAA